ncbi:hypothetical protein MIC448_290035 [Microbacterium sp. C448]|nr:hypothetical protein MIC448_290035 [Microbacterium sp. C448]
MVGCERVLRDRFRVRYPGRCEQNARPTALWEHMAFTIVPHGFGPIKGRVREFCAGC